MKLDDLVAKLDLFFNVHAFDERDGWHPFWGDPYREAFRRFARPNFIEGGWNGLMLENPTTNRTINRVYLVVFPTEDILDTIIAQEVERDAPGALIFSHHASGFSEKELSFKPIPTEQLEELREHNISYYNCHAPLDCHQEISTGNALANALGLQGIKRFAEYYGGFAGVHGTIPAIAFQKFAQKLETVCELPYLRYDQCRHNGHLVEHIAILPGGGDDPQLMKEAQALGADTYITGHWWLFGSSEFAAQRRREAAPEIAKLKMNLLSSSHYSSEFVVMRDQMVEWFSEYEVDAILMRQQDPWH